MSKSHRVVKISFVVNDLERDLSLFKKYLLT